MAREVCTFTAERVDLITNVFAVLPMLRETAVTGSKVDDLADPASELEDVAPRSGNEVSRGVDLAAIQ